MNAMKLQYSGSSPQSKAKSAPAPTVLSRRDFDEIVAIVDAMPMIGVEARVAALTRDDLIEMIDFRLDAGVGRR